MNPASPSRKWPLVALIASAALIASLYYASRGEPDQRNDVLAGQNDASTPLPIAPIGSLSAGTTADRIPVRDGSVADGEEETESRNSTAVDAQSTDGAGILHSTHLKLLEGTHDRFMAVTGGQESSTKEAVMIQKSLATKCVANLMRVRGLAQYEFEPGKSAHSFKPSPGQWAFGSSGGKFTFQQGEYPPYDIAQERISAVIAGDPIEPLTASELQEFESLYEQTLQELEQAIEN